MLNFTLFGITFSPSFYGLMYILGFLGGYYYFLRKKIFCAQELESLFFYIFFGVVLGGRIGYIVFYDLGYYFSHPLKVFAVWEGGMSFHGGVLGVTLAMYFFSRKYKFSFLKLADEVCSILPLGLFFGRIGNYFNKELLGFAYTGPFAVVTEKGSFFPSPLLEALLEGFVLLTILQILIQKKLFDGQVASIFLIGYGVFRIFVEVFFRSPDAHIGYILPYISLGTILSSVMIIMGIWAYVYFSKNTTSSTLTKGS